MSRIAATALLTVLAMPCYACGYEDPQAVAMGALNFVYPDSLHVGTAIWQAQMDGVLPRDMTPTVASSVPLPRSFAGAGTSVSTSNDPTRVAALMDALRVIEQVRKRLASGEDLRDQPPLAMVYASKVLWTRFVVTAHGVAAQTHANGPEPGDLVMITEATVIQELVSGALAPGEASRRKLVRFYGDDAATARAQQWLQAFAPPARDK